MKNGNIFIIIFFLLAGCKSDKSANEFSGEYKGAWAETRWSFKFFPNKIFHFKSEGHFGDVESKGIYERRQDSLFLIPADTNLIKYGVVNSLYLIDGDSCIIDFKLKFDYCKTMDWSEKRLIKYPQINTSDLKVISEVESMLQNTLESDEIKEQIRDTSKNLIIEEYFELNSGYKNQLRVFGKPVIFKSKKDIKNEQIKNYIQVDDINFNVDFTNIYLNVIPIPLGKSVLADFAKEGKKWKRIK